MAFPMPSGPWQAKHTAPNTSLPCCSRFSSSGLSGPPRRPPPNVGAGVSRRSPTSATPFALFAACAALITSAASGSLNRFAVSIAWMTTFGVGVLGQRAVVVGERSCRRPCRAFRWRESPARACADSGPSCASRTSAGVERAQSLERPQRVEPPAAAPHPALLGRRPRRRPSAAAAPARPTCPASGPAAAAPCRATSHSDG